MKSRETLPFTSRQSRTELVLALLWLPVHLLLLPNLLVRFFPQLDAAALNVACYAIGAVYMLLTQFRFLRSDFDPLCDRFFAVFLQVLGCYGAMLLFNMALSGLLLGFLEELDNPNNAAVVSMARVSSGPVSAMAVFFAPILEEVMFRGALFGALRHRNRLLAYIAGMTLFPLYHVWGYALSDPTAWIYFVQYIPVSYLLCRCYERCDSIWGSIALHMLINYLALHALTMLEKLV